VTNEGITCQQRVGYQHVIFKKKTQRNILFIDMHRINPKKLEVGRNVGHETICSINRYSSTVARMLGSYRCFCSENSYHNSLYKQSK
jgi:hypothetical protein